MKASKIRFFSPQENSKPKPKEKSAPKSVPVTGYISTTGKLVFPDKSIAQLGFDPASTPFKIGVQDGKRKIKSLFLIPAVDGDSDTFELEKAAKSYSVALPVILQKGGIDYPKTKYAFTIKPFDYDTDVTGYELQLDDPTPKPAYTGKPRGRKPLNKEA